MTKYKIDESLKEELKSIPNTSGIYMMLNNRGDVIYIGKANKLKSRIRSYLNVKSWDARPKLHFMMPKVQQIKTIVTTSEKEALILEANLVNKYQPKYNVTLKDDKKFPWLMITYDEEYPRIVPIRDVVGFKNKFPTTKNKFFGPYTDASAMWGTYKILKEGFQLRIRRKPLFKDRPCMNYHIGFCSGPCQKLISYDEYHKIVKQVEDFLLGKYDMVLKNLKEEMNLESKNLNYEKAAKIRDTIKKIERMLEKQTVISDDISLSQDIFAAAFNKDHKNMVLELFVIRKGKVIGVESFSIKIPAETTIDKAFVDSIKQYYSRVADDVLPNEIIVQYDLPEKDYIEEWLSTRHSKKIKIKCPKKGKNHSLVMMAQESAKHALQRILMSHNVMIETLHATSLQELQKELNLRNHPNHIECFDISHLGGTGTVASMVCFINGQPDKNKYRKFKIRTLPENKIDDFESLREVVRRRYLQIVAHPDLIIIDGGKGQLSAVRKVLDNIGIDLSKIDLISIAKKEEKIFKFVGAQFIASKIPKSSKALHLLQRIRNEAHRFAITYQRDRRSKMFFG